MTHLGLYCPAETGHLNTMLPLGQSLQQRGHRVTYFGVPDAKAKVESAGLGFYPLGEQVFPPGTTPQIAAQLGELKGLAALQFTLACFRKTATVFLEEAPASLKKAAIEALVVDQITPEGGTVADLLDIPYVSLCSALPINQEGSVPPFFTTWTYQPNRWAYLRNGLVYQLTNPFGAGAQKVRNRYRRQWQLPPESSADSQLAILSQQPAAFDYPRQHLPPWFHYTGPYHNPSSRHPVDFPWDKLVDQPLIYASMGTLQNRLTHVFEAIAAACCDLDAQLVISLGGSAEPDSMPALPGTPLIVRYAPQLELLQRAALTITHAGMNTVLESLTYGVPMVAIPVTNDQPGVATRVAWTGAGEILPLGQLQTETLRQRVQTVLTQPSYRHNAARLQTAIQQSGGTGKAADIIETAIATRKPVFRV